MSVNEDRFAESHFELRWPRDLLKQELARLIGEGRTGVTFSLAHISSASWNDEVDSLLEEAFTYEEPLREFNATSASSGGFSADLTQATNMEWLSALHNNVARLPLPERPLPYWSQRRKGFVPELRLDFESTTRRFRELVHDFEKRGYLVQAFGYECVDEGDVPGTLGEMPVERVHAALGKDLWPVDAHWQEYDADALCDIMEFLHDHVARPSKRSYHSFGHCGYHYSHFRRQIARDLYRLRINELLHQSEMRLVMNASGRIEESSGDQLQFLTDKARSDPTAGGDQHDELETAVSQFLRRGAGIVEKRQALVTLAGILEARREEATKYLASKDEGALFEIANKFNLRHRKADQKTEYDTELYFQWLFYWYLATVRLLDRILERRPTPPVRLGG